MMSNEEIYWEEQEYKRAQEIMQKNVMEVTKEEIDNVPICKNILSFIFGFHDPPKSSIILLIGVDSKKFCGEPVGFLLLCCFAINLV